jgi:predicted NodU family carbamoyl transferase
VASLPRELRKYEMQIGMLVNTSFNFKGEPIVESPSVTRAAWTAEARD